MDHSNEQPQKVRAKEAARQLGIGLTKLKQLRQSGQIGHQRLGHRTIYFYQSELDAYQQSKTTNATRIAV